MFSRIKEFVRTSATTTYGRKRAVFFGVLIIVGIYLFWGIPLPTKLSSPDIPVSTKLFDRNGKLIYEIFSDRRRTPIKLEELPEYVAPANIPIPP